MQFDRVKRIFLVSDSDIRRSEENTNEHTNNSSINNKCLQGLILIWIDEHAKNYSLNSLRTKAILKEISDNNCLFINDINDLSTIIQKQKEENKEILIIMGESYAKNHLKNEIITEKIIIFSPNYQDKDDLKKLNSNILNICTNFEELQNILENNCESLSFGLFTNQTMESFRPLTPLKGADNCNSYYDYMLFIEILKDMPQTKESKDIMLNKAKDYYEKIEKNSKYPTKIEKFRNKYISNDAIRWYQKDSFVYRIINRAFRTNNVQIWYLFRYYINDLCKQIENIHKIQNIQQSLKLYRGQIISTNELKILQLNPNCKIAMNGFFSTSRNENGAEAFIAGGMNTNNYKIVLFQIFVNTSQLKNISFVDVPLITKKFEDEEEILFNIGTVFKIIKITEGLENNPWQIEMEATDEGLDEMKKNINLAKDKFSYGNINLSFGQLLIEMNQYIKGESYYQMLLDILPKFHKDRSSVHDQLGILYMRLTDWKEAFKHFQIAYEIKKKKFHLNRQELSITRNNIGNYYLKIGNYDQALRYYIKALRYSPNEINKIVTQLNICSIYILNKNSHKAYLLIIEIENILRKNYSSSYIELIKCYLLLGNIYFDQEKYFISKGYYDQALNISQKYLNINHKCRINSLFIYIDFYKKQNLNKEAIEFCQKNFNDYKQHLLSNHIINAYFLMKFAELYNDKDDYKEKENVLKEALVILEENFHLEYETTAKCLISLAKFYLNNNEKLKALEYYKRTIEIYEKIYPENHQIIQQTNQYFNHII